MYAILLVNLNLILRGVLAVSVNLDLKGRMYTLYCAISMLDENVLSIVNVACLLITSELREDE